MPNAVDAQTREQDADMCDQSCFIGDIDALERLAHLSRTAAAVEEALAVWRFPGHGMFCVGDRCSCGLDRIRAALVEHLRDPNV